MIKEVITEERKKTLKEALVEFYYSWIRPILKNRRAFIGSLILLMFISMATVGPLIVPLDLTTRWEQRFLPPSWEHPLGTDYAGRDIFQQIVHGSREVLTIAFLAAAYAILIAISIGIVSGYLGGVVDAFLMGITDIFLTIPSFPVMLIIAVTVRVADPFSFAAILAIWMWAGLARSIRAQVRSLREREFIEAAKVLGMSTRHIVFKEILPNIAPYITIYFIRMMKGAITASVGIMFLGVVPLSIVHWGVMMNLAMFQYGAVYVPEGIFYALSPLMAIVLLEYGAICFASGVEEIVNPRLKTYE
ncbi:MAG: ABC transporter permease [Thermoprotei archaeon]|nr:MAG: ABC transporter permease [Thermoprotei archaeon]